MAKFVVGDFSVKDNFMSPTYITAVVMVLTAVLKLLNIDIGSEALMTTITTFITVFGGIYVMYRQVTTGRSTLQGTRP